MLRKRYIAKNINVDISLRQKRNTGDTIIV